MVGVTREPAAVSQRFPLDIEFQKSLLRLLSEDQSFGHAASKHLRPEHFEHEILGWAYGFIQRHVEQYNVVPSLQIIMQETRSLDPSIRPIYTAMIDQVRQSSLRDADWLRDQTLDFVKRNIFVRAFHEGKELYNSGSVVQAYDLMQGKMEEITRTVWEPVDRTWFYSDLRQRQGSRNVRATEGDSIPTGFPWLDHILRGGLHFGELGIWMAYAKVGKTTLLITLGVAATRRNFRVLHVVLEGSRRLIEDRYDSAFLQEVYAAVKSGDIDVRKYQMALKEYQMLKDTLVLRAFIDKWDFNIIDIDNELRDLERNHDWRPDLIIIDYADLMTGRDKKYYRTETESQRAAIRDVKRLSTRDYAIWTASQAQRPKKDDTAEDILTSRSIADTYEKVRAADFLGSLNQTAQEKESGFMRLHAEMYRDNKAGQTLTVRCALERMQIQQSNNGSMPVTTTGQATKLGYKQGSAF